MKEAAEREQRMVTKHELLAGKFPTKEMCPTCWKDDDLKEFDRDAVFDFLKQWYWPKHERHEKKFRQVLKRNLMHYQGSAKEHDDFVNGHWSYLMIPVVFVLLLVMFSPEGTKERKMRNRKRK
eukprot:CAMPEP_0118700950 /NCGR_PEP_ID=MMETSP0800-20121206/16925_1 /TAXON_ID=210618 ORGANISM="Striatella unipunctata, Strain CCMP2910" /NCGR_SAMPLE_ID=MMETSP0800 /ASSEMBLY_ACC=CAM_ASM_000638 /LENGTH=122 /DNA_ID=CAMNT_0006601707 /DNA_START=112 /DNA_END=480 /DNA_ORIENTATION=+